MSKFQPGFKIDSEQGSGDARIVKLDQGAGPKVTDFQLPVLEKRDHSHYGSGSTGFGKEQASFQHPSRNSFGKPTASNQKDRRFTLSQLVRSHLSSESEEQKLFEQRVAEQVAALDNEVRGVAREEGYEAGFSQGREEATRQFHTEGRSRVERLEKVVAEIESAKEEFLRANEKYLLEMIYRISRTVLLKELSLDRDYLLRLVTELVHRVGVRDNLLIRISQSEAETIGKLKEGLDKSLGALKNLTIEPSALVSQGGCLLETEWNAIDARIETQLKGIHEALLGQDAGGSA
jgi:flagellar assembly protein FliH